MRLGGKCLCSKELPLTPPLNSDAIRKVLSYGWRVSFDPPGADREMLFLRDRARIRASPEGVGVCHAPWTVLLPYRPDGLLYDR